MSVKVKVTEYRGLLVIEAMEPEKPEPGWAPIEPGKIGCVLQGTGRKLGVSKEALALLDTVRKCEDDLGSIDWFECRDGTHAFSWIGGPFRILDPRRIEMARSSRVYPEACIRIENQTSPDLRAMIDERLGAEER